MSDQPPSENKNLPNLQELFAPLQEASTRYNDVDSGSNIPDGTIAMLQEARDLHIYMKAHRAFLEVLTDIVNDRSAQPIKPKLDELLDERWKIQDKYEEEFVDYFCPQIG